MTNFLPKQMNGPVLSALHEAIGYEFLGSQAVYSYLAELSIRTAHETEIETIGRIIGYPRPLVPVGFNDENVMLLGTLPLEQDQSIGLATIDSEVGGTLTSVEGDESNFMSLGLYRKFIEKIAKIKRFGITIKCIDEIASTISENYTISWDENSDIVVNFTEPIGYKNVWILTQIFYRVATEPQVQISSGGDDE